MSKKPIIRIPKEGLSVTDFIESLFKKLPWRFQFDKPLSIGICFKVGKNRKLKTFKVVDASMFLTDAVDYNDSYATLILQKGEKTFYFYLDENSLLTFEKLTA